MCVSYFGSHVDGRERDAWSNAFTSLLARREIDEQACNEHVSALLFSNSIRLYILYHAAWITILKINSFECHLALQFCSLFLVRLYAASSFMLSKYYSSHLDTYIFRTSLFSQVDYDYSLIVTSPSRALQLWSWIV